MGDELLLMICPLHSENSVLDFHGLSMLLEEIIHTVGCLRKLSDVSTIVNSNRVKCKKFTLDKVTGNEYQLKLRSLNLIKFPLGPKYL